MEQMEEVKENGGNSASSFYFIEYEKLYKVSNNVTEAVKESQC